MARLANLVTPSGEMGDTTDVLQAREDFNALQTEVMYAELIQAERLQAERTQAEYRSTVLQLQHGGLDTLVAQAEGYESSASDAPTLRTEPTAAAQTAEVVVMSSGELGRMSIEGRQSQSSQAADVTRAKEPTPVETRTPAEPLMVLRVDESAPN